MIEIRSKRSGEVLLTVNAPTLSGGSFRHADLKSANLLGHDISNADFAYAQLQSADLRDANAVGCNFFGASLKGANLSVASLVTSDFRLATVTGARFNMANLKLASFSGSDLAKAKFTNAYLSQTNFERTNLEGTDFHCAILNWTNFAFCHNLDAAKGLGTVEHYGPSALDRDTLESCIRGLPDTFLIGAGYTPYEVESLRALYAGNPISFSSCFLSHAESDMTFANRLLEDLRQNKVTCWRYKEDLRGGRDWGDQINEAITVHDKLILICSRNSVYRDNVVKEILRAIDEERRTGKQKLFPIRLDDHILSPEFREEATEFVRAGKWRENWVIHVCRKHIPDFREWQDNREYSMEFKKLLEALRSADA